jgi:hypothetical protein
LTEQGAKFNNEFVAVVTAVMPQTATLEKRQEENQSLKYPVCQNVQ